MSDFDIYTNRVPWSLLTEDEKAALNAHNGEFEFFNPMAEKWSEVKHSAISPRAPYTICRAVKPAPSKPSIDWSHVAPKYKWLARGADGVGVLYSSKPEKHGNCWWVELGFRTLCLASPFATYSPGDCDWCDSLISRPGAETESEAP